MTPNPDILRRVPLFKNLPADDLQHLYQSLDSCEFAPGELVFREGEPGDTFFVVQEGQIEIIKALGMAEEQILARRSQGEFVGEMSLLDPDGLRTASVRAVNRARLWRLTRQEFNALLSRHPELAYEMVRVLSERLKLAHNLSISELQAKNRQLTRAYEELKAAQRQIIEKERLDRELEVAYDIQMSVLPRSLPTQPGYDFGARITPARRVGGDFYDLVRLGDDRVAISIGDVTDKGVPAAIFMAQVHALMRAETNRSAAPSRVLANVNRHLLEMNARGLFATVLYGVLDIRSGEFSYARAGHDLPLVVSGQGGVAQARMGTGQPLGLLEKPLLDEQTLKIPPGGFVLLYTDGVTDSRNPAGQLFGLERLKPVLAQLAGMPAQHACDAILAALLAYQSGAAQEDDITLVAIRSEAQGG